MNVIWKVVLTTVSRSVHTSEKFSSDLTSKSDETTHFRMYIRTSIGNDDMWALWKIISFKMSFVILKPQMALVLCKK